ncbi:MAG TPA: TIGR03000 domain-containing protein [Gemmatales bacterium]|nr:TIGR03000 domain-containing protein [Gemmatales bacterium]
MSRLLFLSLIAVVAIPSFASAQYVGFGFGFRGGYPGYGFRGYYAPGVVYAPYPGPTYVVVPSAQPVSVASAISLKARITVVLPDANAELFVQNQPLRMVGRIREFSTQDLLVGNRYSYTLTMQGNVDGHGVIETRKVEFQAGSMVTVDFTKPFVEQLPQTEYEPRHAVPPPALLSQPK